MADGRRSKFRQRISLRKITRKLEVLREVDEIRPLVKDLLDHQEITQDEMHMALQFQTDVKLGKEPKSNHKKAWEKVDSLLSQG